MSSKNPLLLFVALPGAGLLVLSGACSNTSYPGIAPSQWDAGNLGPGPGGGTSGSGSSGGLYDGAVDVRLPDTGAGDRASSKDVVATDAPKPKDGGGGSDVVVKGPCAGCQ